MPIARGASEVCELAMNELSKRVISAFVAVVIFLIILFLPDLYFNLAFILLAGMLVFELTRAFGFDHLLKGVSVAFAVGIAALCVYAYDYMFAGIFLFAVTAAGFVLVKPEKYNIRMLIEAVFSVVYVGVFTSFLPRILATANFGKFTLLFVFIAAWLSDTGAYFAGRFFGRHKLAPTISPKKTVEGAVGGVVSSVVFCLAYGWGLTAILDFHVSFGLVAAAAVVASILGQVGDLLASMIKRECGIKDFGNIMPGHGGMMDRCDSVVLIGPFLYYFICMFGNLLS